MHVLDNGICRTCNPERSTASRHFDPHQLRDPHTGKWVDEPGAGGVAEKLAKALTGQDALDAAPAKLKRAPNGHTGDYTGEGLTGPPGIGSARALSEYEGLEYGTINGALRSGHIDAEDQQRITEIDKTMKVSRLTHDVKVGRVIQHGDKVFGAEHWFLADMNSDDFDVQDRGYERWLAGDRPDLTGLRWREPAYSSTTADPARPAQYGDRWRRTNSEGEGEPVIMTILVPKGTGGVQLSEMGHEAEILLERGLTFEITKDNGVTDGFRHLDVRAVPDGE